MFDKENSKNETTKKKVVAKTPLKIVIDLPKSATGEKFEYVVPESEMETTAHVYQEQLRFASDSPTRLSKGHSQKYTRQGWENFRTYGISQGWTIVLLHAPKDWPTEVVGLDQIGRKTKQR
ncbi:MAG: hypothetical protein Unbinned5350contig1001_51 [Prokaryotic dsDNA virus sp.]|nr:MAG: hypothetical protein Unbinned5350contig1001_51 [Prokaryotic dsDNA virus sp.]|tara:strand:- start:4767 stop:5129 length:363 start_codon:yes stop_codon:yes gene_type:complete